MKTISEAKNKDLENTIFPLITDRVIQEENLTFVNEYINSELKIVDNIIANTLNTMGKSEDVKNIISEIESLMDPADTNNLTTLQMIDLINRGITVEENDARDRKTILNQMKLMIREAVENSRENLAIISVQFNNVPLCFRCVVVDPRIKYKNKICALMSMPLETTAYRATDELVLDLFATRGGVESIYFRKMAKIFLSAVKKYSNEVSGGQVKYIIYLFNYGFGNDRLTSNLGFKEFRSRKRKKIFLPVYAKKMSIKTKSF